ncbi:MAG TPA: AAA family ATPase [Candidatus Acidoferrales bacterium]|nr:AAA family ATPase [Candidatus Acidoferrales bacterium]
MTRPEGRALPTGTVTFLLTDIESSTQRWERSPDAMKQAMVAHDELLSRAIPQHAGTHVESGREGDSVLAAFTRATDAVACAIQVQRELAARTWPEGADLHLRMAIHSGEVEARSGHYYGQAVYRCARLLATAHGDQVLVSHATRDLIVDSLPAEVALRDLGSHRLRDLQRPEQVFQVLAPGLRSDFPPLKSLDPKRHNLPISPTRFVGRASELRDLHGLLGSERLVTLTGAGGTGKTRLALQAAADLIEDVPDGVWLVQLAPLTDPELVPQTAAQALGVQEETGTPIRDTLRAWLLEKQLLLVLDNCEHLVASAAEFAAGVLRVCPQVRLLATSREALNIAGEVVRPVPPLALPEAVALFADRSSAISPGFRLTESNAETVADICRRVEGFPLAVELAAGRVQMMSPAEILERLQDSFRLLAGTSRSAAARHQTLEAAMEWSYRLLTGEEKALFRRFSVFAGGFTLEAAEAVAGDGEGVVDLLQRLIEKSLVVVEQGDSQTTRYRLLEVVVEYARERLEEQGDQPAAQRSHADYYLGLAEAAARLYSGADGSEWLRRMEVEQDNLRAVFDRDRAKDEELELRLVSSLRDFWDYSDHVQEGRSRLASVLARGPGQTRLWAAVLHSAGVLAWAQADLGSAAAQAGAALEIRRRLGDREGVVESLELLARVAFSREDFALARGQLGEGLQLARQLSDHDMIGKHLFRLGFIETYAGSLERARGYFEESLAELGVVGNRRMSALVMAPLGHVHIRLGQLQAARECLVTGLRELGGRANSRIAANFLECFAELAAEAGEMERAICLAGAASSVRQATEETPSSPIQTEIRQRLKAVQEEPPNRAAWERGSRMSRPEAIAYALAE